jgi:type IV pilus assembly protein PilW
MTNRFARRALRPRLAMTGMSLVELMIALALGMIVMAAMVTVFASSSANRQEIERASRQIENGRYAMQLLSDDLRLAGFYGEFNVKSMGLPNVLVDPCSVVPSDWALAMPASLIAYDTGALAPTCTNLNVVAGTDIMVVRRASSCEAGVGTCPPLIPGAPYVQVAKCGTETPTKPYVIGLSGATTFDLHMRDCATPAGLRQYLMRSYYISSDNGHGVAIPTLKRMEFTGANFVDVPLVEGIEQINYEYGIDNDGDGSPDVFSADPTSLGATPKDQAIIWSNVVAVRINLLARSIEPSVNYTDSKTYTLGLDKKGAPVTVTPGDHYRRHAYTSLVRVVNVAERKDTP